MNLTEHVAATYAAIGQEISDVGLAVVVADLKAYQLPAVVQALARCRGELRRIALSDILDRIPGGHPGPEEAWAMVARCLNDERVTVVWTDEMAAAFGVALNLQDDEVAARMAFKEAYARLVAEARSAGKPVRWTPSLGWDHGARAGVLEEAVRLGRLSAEHVAGLLPAPPKPLSVEFQKLLEGAAAPF